MGFFGKGNRKNAETNEDRQRQVQAAQAAAQAAEQQYGPIVRDCLTRLQVWAFPYSQVDGWEIWHADVQGQRIVDVRVQLVLDAEPSFTVKSLFWGDTDIENSASYDTIALTPVDLYDALRRAAVQEA